MNGQLSEQPLAELIREISEKRLSGRLRVQQNRIAAVIYFKDGECLYAAANVRTLRLREYLTKLNLLTEHDLLTIDVNESDLELATTLVDNNLIQAKTIREVQLKQISDVLRLALLWVEGSWQFDHRSQLNEKVDLNFDPASLFLDAARRLPPSYAATRFPNENEILSVNDSAAAAQVEPKEGFVLSRLDRAMPLKELLTTTGLSGTEALKIIYGLALSNHIGRESWNKAFPDVTLTPSQQRTRVPPTTEREEAKEVDEKDLAVFLDQIESAGTFYDVLSIANNASAADLKDAYYDFARRYHPDRFRRKDLGPLRGRLESAFARITQAYETLGDQTSRANYDSRLEARARSRSTSEPTQPSSTVAPTGPGTAGGLSIKEKAEESFKEGQASLKSGDAKKAVAHFGFAAQACPNEARYRAFYGQALATFDNSRRQAEVELQAALKLEPNNPNYRIMLAQLYKALGFTKRARAEAERALASAPHHEGANALLRDLP